MPVLKNLRTIALATDHKTSVLVVELSLGITMPLHPTRSCARVGSKAVAFGGRRVMKGLTTGIQSFSFLELVRKQHCSFGWWNGVVFSALFGRPLTTGLAGA
jgi:hypothetical protein